MIRLLPGIAVIFVSTICGFGQKGDLLSSKAATAKDAKLLLQKAADACLKIRTIEYKIGQTHVDHNDQVPFAKATIRQARAAVAEIGFLPGRFIVDGDRSDKDGPRVRFAYSYDGRSFRILDPVEKVVKVVKSPTPYKAGQLLGSVGMIGISAFSDGAPFSRSLAEGEDYLYEGKRTVKGVECDVISFATVVKHPSFGSRKTQSRWFIGVRDGIPRGNQIGNVLSTIEILKLNDKKQPSDFFIPILSGYGEKLITGTEAMVKGLLPLGVQAPDFTLLDPAGNSHSLKDYRGKVIVMDFWGTWCVPCWKAMPIIQNLHEKYRDRGVVFFGISVADSEGDPVAFMKNKGFTYKLLLNGDAAAEIYRAITLPTLYVIGADGLIVHAETGYRPGAKDELDDVILRQLASLKNKD